MLVSAVRVISRKQLIDFWQRHPDAEKPLRTWFVNAAKSHWSNPQAIKSRFQDASFLPGNRVVFNIAGNKYRLIVVVHYNREIVFIRFVGTHKQYDRIDAETV
jgi:mRNA interferase HigB